MRPNAIVSILLLLVTLPSALAQSRQDSGSMFGRIQTRYVNGDLPGTIELCDIELKSTPTAVAARSIRVLPRFLMTPLEVEFDFILHGAARLQ